MSNFDCNIGGAIINKLYTVSESTFVQYPLGAKLPRSCPEAVWKILVLIPCRFGMRGER